MGSAVSYLTIVISDDLESSPSERVVEAPTWAEVDNAIAALDGSARPAIRLSLADDSDDENEFSIVGSDGRFVLFSRFEEEGWTSKNPNRADRTEVEMWDGEQGYLCEERDVLTDLDLVRRIVRVLFDTGSYAALNEVR